MSLKDLLNTATSEILDEIIAIRRHLHQFPELSFDEVKTAQFVSDQLTSWGITHQKGMVKTGVVATIESPNSQAKWIALRADLDALPILEKNETSYVSVNKGIMHACGHDVHTAILLGTAKVIHALKDQLTVNIKFIFQPGEEKLPGGASLMIAEGVLENPSVSEIYALHVFPELEVGKIGFREGMYMASCDEIRMTIKGKGGHAAMPHLNIDPILITSHLIVALQQVVSRNCPPQIPCVLSFGKIEGLGATNVIPDEVYLEGTFRTMNETWRTKAHQLIKEMSEQLTKSMGASADVEIAVGYPYLENHVQLTQVARERATKMLGNENIVDLELRLTGEDFAYYSQKIPATFIRIGVRNESKGIIYPVHNSKFDIDESALLTGMLTFLSQVFLRG
jgi:amidohydrolase